MEIALAGKVHGHRFTFESEILIEAARRGHRTLAVAIPGRYPVQARASHFRPVIDGACEPASALLGHERGGLREQSNRVVALFLGRPDVGAANQSAGGALRRLQPDWPPG
jgi:hypothetical protein